MKSIFILCCIFTSAVSAFGQYDTTAPYLKTKMLPDFRLLTIDSVELNQTVLDKNKSTIIMLFNPECDHCQKQLDLLLSLPEVTAQAQLILSSNETQAKNRAFYECNRLDHYSFVHLGKDIKYFFGSFYQPRTIPVLAFYNREKQLVFFNQGNVKTKQVLQALAQ